jgi:hypothetical protein
MPYRIFRATWRKGTGTTSFWAMGPISGSKGIERLTGDNRTARIHLRGGTSADLSFSLSLDTNTAMGQRAVNLMQAVPNVRAIQKHYILILVQACFLA